jgi:uncharacterized UPF0160 family protein
MKTIITHPGIFHADDVLATAILLEAYNTEPCFIVRRMPTVQDTPSSNCIIVDVGRTYNPAKQQFDHHQWADGNRPDEANRPNGGWPYAAAGLVWKEHGLTAVRNITHAGYDEDVLMKLTSSVDAKLIAAIDCHDVGIWPETDIPTFNFSAFIVGMNDPEADDAAFTEAVKVCRELLRRAVRNVALAHEDEEAVAQAEVFGGTLLLPHFCHGWQRAIQARQDYETLMFVAWEDSTKRGGWKLQGVADSPGSKTTRLPFPEEWWGADPDALVQAAGITAHESQVFCAPGGWLFGACTRADVLIVAEQVIREAHQPA